MREVRPPVDDPLARPNVVVVMPAYNAGRTLKMTYEDVVLGSRIKSGSALQGGMGTAPSPARCSRP